MNNNSKPGPNLMMLKTNGDARKPAVTGPIKEAGKKPIIKITFDDKDINQTNKNKSTSSPRILLLKIYKLKAISTCLLMEDTSNLDWCAYIKSKS